MAGRADINTQNYRKAIDLKILFVHCIPEYEGRGGAQITLWYLMRAMIRRGHDCRLVALSAQRGRRDLIRDGVAVTEIGIRNLYWPYAGRDRSGFMRAGWHAIDSYNPSTKAPISDVIAEFAPDVCSAHNLPGWSISIWEVLHQARIPVVQVLHDNYLLCVKGTMFRNGHNCARQCTTCRMFRLPHRRKSRSVDAVVGVSRFILDRHLDHGMFAGVPIARVIHNARDPEHVGLTQAIDTATSSVAPGLTFGYIGRVETVKGVELAIEAFSEIPGSEIRLKIAGSGKSSYIERLRGRSNDERISFLGRVEAARFFTQIDVLVLPSLLHDTLPGVVFEALAFGRPVIAARRGGVPEMVFDGHNGLLFDPESPGALARCMQRLIQDRELLQFLADNSASTAKTFMDIDRLADEYVSVYTTAISNRQQSLCAR